MREFEKIKVGDTVIRMLAGVAAVKMVVTKVDEVIHCGDWTFSRKNGAEIDEEIGFTEAFTGSFLLPPSKQVEGEKLLEIQERQRDAKRLAKEVLDGEV